MRALLAFLLSSCTLVPATHPVRYAASKDIASVTEAADWWDSIVGCRVLEPAVGDNADVLVVRGGPNKIGPDGIPWMGAHYAGQSKIDLYDGAFSGGTPYLWLVELHEFGHALGLDHSPNDWSIMYFRVQGPKMHEDGWIEAPFPRVEDASIKWLRARYCR